MLALLVLGCVTQAIIDRVTVRVPVRYCVEHYGVVAVRNEHIKGGMVPSNVLCKDGAVERWSGWSREVRSRPSVSPTPVDFEE